MITQRQLFLSNVAQTSPSPLLLEIDHADGVFLYDTAGKEYIDLISGISVSNLGHRHPEVIKAITDQLNRYSHLMVYGEFVQAPQVELAAKLNEMLPERLSTAYFTNSGSEATEGALKLAKRYTGRSEIISFYNGYHGSTQGALSVMGNESFKSTFRPLLPDIRFLSFNSLDDLDLISFKTACVIVEPLQGEAGCRVGEIDFILKLAERCRETNTLLIFDEIQSGLGRTGKLFAFEDYNVSPDILLLAKSLGGGMPLGVFISSSEIMSVLSHNPVLGHITTFGGHPVCCAAGLAAIKVLTRDGLAEKVSGKEKFIREKLKHPSIKAIHGKGLLLAVEFNTADFNKAVIARCLEHGLLTDWFLFADHMLRIAPPLIITEDQLERACEIILKSVEEVTATSKLW
jgi:acetylornithine/N-succinyldiaminopimelate aminotransferase